jgi:hypothetical protein
MDEQTRLNLEQRLEDVLRRDLGAISVRPFAMYSRSPRAATVHPIRRVFSIAGAATVSAVVILVALAAAFALKELRQTPATVSPPSSTPTGSPSPSSAISALPSATAPVAVATPVETGAISGRFGYPSDFIPPVTVYAISTTDQRVWFSVDFPGFGNPPRPTLPPGQTNANYTITGVAPGSYWVVAYRNDGQSVDPGLYSRRVACRTGGAPSTCVPADDLSPAIVTVKAGQTTTGINIEDWVPPAGPGRPSSFPPRPTPR